MTKKKLLIIPADDICTWISKGEIVQGYYNPKNLFDEIHILSLYHNNPDLRSLQKMAGDAEVYFHSYPPPPAFFKKSLGWQFYFLNQWGKSIIPLIKNMNPDIIRCYGAHLNSYLALKIKQALGIPYVVSLHINPDINIRGDTRILKEKIITWSSRKIEKISLVNANCVLPVYEPIVPYLESMGIKNYQVCYNVINSNNLIKKENYNLSSPIKVISIGRQFCQKNPENIIKALKNINNIEITFVGDGNLRDDLKSLAQREGIEKKTKFVKSIENDELCKNLHSYDFLALHTEYFELSKVMLESFLVGLPVLLNHRNGDPVPELSEEICLRVPNTVEGYNAGVVKMIEDHKFRKALGRNAYHVSQEKWAPEKCEQAYKDIYKHYMR